MLPDSKARLSRFASISRWESHGLGSGEPTTILLSEDVGLSGADGEHLLAAAVAVASLSATVAVHAVGGFGHILKAFGGDRGAAAGAGSVGAVFDSDQSGADSAKF